MASNDRQSLAAVSGPESMAAPGSGNGAGRASSSMANGSTASVGNGDGAAPKKKRHRAGKKRRNRRQSFVAPSESTAAEDQDDPDRRPSLLDNPRSSGPQNSFYRLKSAAKSNTSLESEALLDHRGHQSVKPRRRSNSMTMPQSKANTPFRNRFQHHESPRTPKIAISENDEDEDPTDRTPLLGSSLREHGNRPSNSRSSTGLGGGGHKGGSSFFDNHRRRSSTGSPDSSRKKGGKVYPPTIEHSDEDFDVNNPPSVPGSPRLGSLDDVMIDEFENRGKDNNRDAVIDIDRVESREASRTSSHSDEDGNRRWKSVKDLAEKDVCYPADSELGEDDYRQESTRHSPRRRRRRQWPDLDVLEDWSMEERKERDLEQIRAKKMTEPVMVGGRLRPSKQPWHRQEDDAPYRYTYFIETFDATIHSRTISELCQFGATFKDLFNPEAPELSDESSDEDAPMSPMKNPSVLGQDTRGRASILQDDRSHEASGSQTPVKAHSQSQTPRQMAKKLGPRPTFWLDVLSPTDQEMKVLAKAFGIHQLTIEDILMQEPREKVELFQNYYFVNYRSFEQDKDSEDYMEPVNIYVVVFRDGVLSFHFSMTPHPANVRRRIRQLNDYMSPSADWISYAIIDDVTDAYAPLVQKIEEEVDDIDDNILELHDSDDLKDEKPKKSAKNKDSDSSSTRSGKNEGEGGGDMLKRVGECRKKVMSLYRLLGNKADVIKGFAKRCNEHWEVAPRSEIGLYLGDIQDHIITMTGNLSHYENLLSRAHSNYLAQINIRMNERAEQTNDVLGKLTVMGTIVLPLNIVTGLWGMNVWVPWQDSEGNLAPFMGITASLIVFSLVCYTLAKKLYGIV